MRDSLKKKKNRRDAFDVPNAVVATKLSTGKINSRPFHVCMYSSLMTICKRDPKKGFWKSKERTTKTKPNK